MACPLAHVVGWDLSIGSYTELWLGGLKLELSRGSFGLVVERGSTGSLGRQGFVLARLALSEVV
jgi:hypothetical protein